MRVQHLCKLAVVVLHSMAFIYNHVLPADLSNKRKIHKEIEKYAISSNCFYLFVCLTLFACPYLSKNVFVFDDVLIGGYEDIELPATKLRQQ